jgi:hypothetical protein
MSSSTFGLPVAASPRVKTGLTRILRPPPDRVVMDAEDDSEGAGETSGDESTVVAVGVCGAVAGAMAEPAVVAEAAGPTFTCEVPDNGGAGTGSTMGEGEGDTEVAEAEAEGVTVAGGARGTESVSVKRPFSAADGSASIAPAEETVSGAGVLCTEAGPGICAEAFMEVVAVANVVDEADAAAVTGTDAGSGAGAGAGAGAGVGAGAGAGTGVTDLATTA